jgi:LPS O-antigen subunit length determinant protein (WzzB/FepE family)
MLATANPDYVFRIVEAPARPDPDEQIAPRKRLIAMLGLALGGGLGVLLALLVDVLRVRAGRR